MSTSTRMPEPRLLIDMPPGFAGIPITGSGEQIADHVRDLAEQMTAAQPELAAANEEHLGELTHFLAQQNVRLFGRFAASDEDAAEPALANLVVAMRRLDSAATDSPNRNMIAAMLVKQYLRRHPDAEARVVQLASGPALVAQRAGEHQISPEASGTPQGVVIPEFKAEFQILAPDAAYLVVMVVTTNSEVGWPAVATEAMRVANSVRFDYSDEDGSAASPDEH